MAYNLFAIYPCFLQNLAHPKTTRVKHGGSCVKKYKFQRSSSMADSDTNKRLSHVEQEVSHLLVSTAGIQATLTTIESSIARLANVQDRPTNWIGIGGLIAVTFGFTMTLMTLLLGATDAKVQSLSNRLSETKHTIDSREVIVHSIPPKVDRALDWLATMSPRIREVERGLFTQIEQGKHQEALLNSYIPTTQRFAERISALESAQARLDAIVERKAND